MRAVVALGGNALARRGEPMTAERLRANVRSACQALAGLAREHEVVITHGNGPQVGLLALQNLAYQDVAAYPLDILGAKRRHRGPATAFCQAPTCERLPDTAACHPAGPPSRTGVRAPSRCPPAPAAPSIARLRRWRANETSPCLALARATGAQLACARPACPMLAWRSLPDASSQ